MVIIQHICVIHLGVYKEEVREKAMMPEDPESTAGTRASYKKVYGRCSDCGPKMAKMVREFKDQQRKNFLSQPSKT